jgi:hypothetical protein
MSPSWFTPQSADRALEVLRVPAAVIARAWRVLERTQPMPARSDSPVPEAYFAAASALRAALTQVEEAGVLVRDARRGRFDFPARRGGRAVLLCWTLGEPVVERWSEAGEPSATLHPLDEGPWDHPP